MRVHYQTFGCKANQYDTERMRQELEARGAETVGEGRAADVVVLNTCTVTNQADAQARRAVRRIQRENPGARVVVAGCSAALRAREYAGMEGVAGVVPGHDPVQVAVAAVAPPAGLVNLGLNRSLDRIDTEPVGGELLRRREAGTRGWLKVQDGCDRKCAFCATRLARGASRSREPGTVVAEARLLARSHPELVLTGVHIGHYGRDLPGATTLSGLVARLLDEVPDVRLRLGSIEATEVDERLLDLLATSGERLAPHLHMPLQSGADPVLRRMRRWHTRDQYRRRALEIAERLPVLGLGADIITGFPGETDEDHEDTRALVEELPFTYLHVFPFSPRDGTVAADLVRETPVPERVAGERSRELRERALEKGARYRRARSGQDARVVLESGGNALTGDYLRVRVEAGPEARFRADVAAGAEPDPRILHAGRLRVEGDDLYIALHPLPAALPSTAAS
jgi:threonylcarbamoyladenosine tRNA methylthiotransferase MtaB